MKYLVVGLGNPGREYESTRHNVGRMAAERVAKDVDATPFKADKGSQSMLAQGKMGKGSLVVALPDTFMNLSGKAVSYLVKTKGVPAERTVVIHDDIDLPFGSMKFSFGRGSGGHRGVESIIKGLKTNEFVRIRVGVCPTTPSGKLRKPSGDEKVKDFLLGEFKKNEDAVLKKILKRVAAAIEVLVNDGRAAAMNEFN